MRVSIDQPRNQGVLGPFDCDARRVRFAGGGGWQNVDDSTIRNRDSMLDQNGIRRLGRDAPAGQYQGTGAVWLNAWTGLYGSPLPWAQGLALLALGGAWALKLAYWRRIDEGRSASTIGSATGLGAHGRVRLFEPPHTEENYLLKEMGFKVARKHAKRLRRLAVILGGVLPLLLTASLLVVGGHAGAALAALAAVAAQTGTLVERWLFFAEGTHTVMLYYGDQAA